jgi:hypothetical protein
MIMKKFAATVVLALCLGGISAPAMAAPLPDNCTKTNGTVTCTEGPGNNQAGVGTSTETQGNTTNTSPEPQDLSTTQNPPKAQGSPITG